MLIEEGALKRQNGGWVATGRSPRSGSPTRCTASSPRASTSLTHVRVTPSAAAR